MESLGPRQEPGGPIYRPLSKRAKWATVALVASAVVDGVAVFSGAAEYRLLDGVETGGFLTDDEVFANDVRQGVIALFQGIVFFTTVVLFLAWFRRAYHNLSPLGAWPLRFERFWVIGAWFVPIMNYFRPKQIANDIWRASDPDAPPDQRYTWEGASVPIVFAFWWILFIVGNSVYSAAFRLSSSAQSFSELKQVTGAYLAADIINVLAAVLAIVFVRRTTARQDARAQALGFDPTANPGRERGEWHWTAVVLPLMLIVVGALGVGAWSAFDEDVRVAPPSGSVAGSNDPGLLIDDDFSSEGAWVVQDDRFITYEYTDGAYRMLIKEPDATWVSAVDLPRESSSMRAEAHMTLEAGQVRRDFYGIACLRSSEAAYVFGLSPDGYYTVFYDSGDQGADLDRIVEDQAREPFQPEGSANRVSISCSVEDGRTRVRMLVNGRSLADETHRSPGGAFAAIEFVVSSGRGGTDVRFDNLVVREPAG